MAITRTARGSASSKSSAVSLTIPSFTVPAGHSLVVGAGYDNAQGAPTSVVHAGRSLRRKAQRDDSINGFHASVWLKGEYRKTQTGTCVLTWASSIGKKCAVASSYDRTHKFDDGKTAIDGDVTNPNTGLGGTLTDLDELVAAFFISEGPGTDHSGHTADIMNAGIFESAGIGQKDGTTGAPPVSNITIIETWLELTSANATRARLLNATQRNWLAILITLQKRPVFFTQGITPHDIETVDNLIATAGGDPDSANFVFNEDTGLWEAYEDTDLGTLRATRDKDGVWTGV